MIYFISLFIVFSICIIGYAFYQDTRNKVWNLLGNHFGAKTTELLENKLFKVQMVFFKITSEKKYDYFNSMKVLKNENGVLIQPTINHYFAKPIFIPWNEMEKIEEYRKFMIKRDVFKIDSLNILIVL